MRKFVGATIPVLVAGAAAFMGTAAAAPVQVPVHVPVNTCGNTVLVIGVLNPAYGNQCLGR
jgi:hypothetical protein